MDKLRLLSLYHLTLDRSTLSGGVVAGIVIGSLCLLAGGIALFTYMGKNKQTNLILILGISNPGYRPS